MKYPMIMADESGQTMFGVREVPDQETAETCCSVMTSQATDT